MTTQEDLLDDGFIEYALYETPDDGQLHTLNIPPTEEQRRTITDRGRNKDYVIQTRLHTCIHGTLDGHIPSSLIVFEYRVKFNKERRAFSTVRTSFSFTKSKNPHSDKTPFVPGHGIEVKAFAPFQNYVQYHETTAEETRERGGKATLGTPSELPVQASLEGSGSDTSKHTQRYFDEGYAGTRHDEERNLDNAVEWYLHHNESQGDGVSPIFRVAILLKREDSELFYGHFVITVEGGIRFAIADTLRSFMMAPDDPIIFNPARKPLWNGSEVSDPKTIGVDPSKLGELANGDMLDGLTMVWGLEPLKKKTGK